MQIHKNSLRGNFNVHNGCVVVVEKKKLRTCEWRRMLANPLDEIEKKKVSWEQRVGQKINERTNFLFSMCSSVNWIFFCMYFIFHLHDPVERNVIH